MVEKLETSAAPRSSNLDRDRSASMAYEGGAAAAEMELEEELRWAARESPRDDVLTRWRTQRQWTKTVLVGALVIGAAAFLTRLALRWTRR
jgi:hypothetical protein